MPAPLLMLMLLAFQQNAKEHVVLEPEGKQITLTGRISLVHGYGPPGWGEDRKHDAHITYWVIDLPNAINTPCTPERPEWKAIDCQSTKRLRLIVEDDDHHLAEARASQGQTAAVDGILHRADTAGEITPIYVEVKEIKLLK